MTIIEEELNIIKQVGKKMAEAKDRDSVNAVYRQARIWNRFHHFFANACSYERYTFLNRKFKHLRWEALPTQNKRGKRHE